ncbi:MAG: MOSC domain-containing protein [Gammaproteobacteria bacterium]|nr:MOSC domain-containing protein [Gammaproteobacteria bacterium]MDH3811281.1 MOSC domain-containing protein [Gammaproteobacteria bacterium]
MGRLETIAHGNKSFQTGICKYPTEDPVRVHALGLPGDAIIATEHHGGADQAIYAYSTDDYDWWATEAGLDWFPGLFGENLTIRDLPTDLNIGDRLLIGEVVLEATAPRIPCDTLTARIGDRGFGMAFRKAERPGIYLRVLNEGEIQSGDVVTLVESAEFNVSILDLFRHKYRLQHDADELRRLLEAPIAERFRVQIEEQLAALG